MKDRESGDANLAVAALMEQARRMVQESGRSRDFDAAQWVAVWLDRALPALVGKRPADFMATVEGRARVSDLLAQQQSGAYA